MSRKRDEPVRLTRIYTGGGDQGETSLGDGTRVPKTDARVQAVGEVDELNSLIGWAAALEGAPEVLQRIQNELFDLGADLATPEQTGRERLRVSQEQIGRLEQDGEVAGDEVGTGGEELAEAVVLVGDLLGLVEDERAVEAAVEGMGCILQQQETVPTTAFLQEVHAVWDPV